MLLLQRKHYKCSRSLQIWNTHTQILNAAAVLKVWFIPDVCVCARRRINSNANGIVFSIITEYLMHIWSIKVTSTRCLIRAKTSRDCEWNCETRYQALLLFRSLSCRCHDLHLKMKTLILRILKSLKTAPWNRPFSGFEGSIGDLKNSNTKRPRKSNTR